MTFLGRNMTQLSVSSIQINSVYGYSCFDFGYETVYLHCHSDRAQRVEESFTRTSIKMSRLPSVARMTSECHSSNKYKQVYHYLF